MSRRRVALFGRTFEYVGMATTDGYERTFHAWRPGRWHYIVRVWRSR